MSDILATKPKLDDESETVEGRLADMIETGKLMLDEYAISDKDKAKIVLSLRQRAMVM